MTTSQPPDTRRSALSLAVLLALVLAVTAQLLTGFWLWRSPGATLLTVHVAAGLATTVLLVAEWTWLLATEAGRARLRSYVAPGAGAAGWIDALFLLAVTATVVLGLLLAGILRLGLDLSLLPLLAAHRGLAAAVLVLYAVHAITAAGTRRRRAGRNRPVV